MVHPVLCLLLPLVHGVGLAPRYAIPSAKDMQALTRKLAPYITDGYITMENLDKAYAKRDHTGTSLQLPIKDIFVEDVDVNKDGLLTMEEIQAWRGYKGRVFCENSNDYLYHCTPRCTAGLNQLTGTTKYFPYKSASFGYEEETEIDDKQTYDGMTTKAQISVIRGEIRSLVLKNIPGSYVIAGMKDNQAWRVLYDQLHGVCNALREQKLLEAKARVEMLNGKACYRSLSQGSEHFVAKNTGKSLRVGQNVESAKDCKKMCTDTTGCDSVLYCPGVKSCSVKDLKLTGKEETTTKEAGGALCEHYYRAQCDEEIDLNKELEKVHAEEDERTPCSSKVHIFESFAGYGACDPEKDTGLCPLRGTSKVNYDHTIVDIKLHEDPNTETSVKLHKGAFKNFNITDMPKKIAFALLDLSLYNTTKSMLNLIKQRMVPGGVILIKDYGWEQYGGIQYAVEDVFFPEAKTAFGDQMTTTTSTTTGGGLWSALFGGSAKPDDAASGDLHAGTMIDHESSVTLGDLREAGESKTKVRVVLPGNDAGVACYMLRIRMPDGTIDEGFPPEVLQHAGHEDYADTVGGY